ncbi:DUF167 family protein [Chitinispirillales bacterium ANBcel5]|uniref:DUF167 domain-containing protein n=1 Tax=Cellulosispirillum alkaliphilum TaxID=3039283 RepID=UPI002A56D3F3|nr:DUF167 family protein [Chitinispirillales bacterium ANBcel5]
MSCTFECVTKPGAKSNRISLSDEGVFSVAVTSPPAEGKANKHLIALLAKELEVKTSSVTIIIGKQGRKKVVKIDGLSKDEVFDRFKQKKIEKNYVHKPKRGL